MAQPELLGHLRRLVEDGQPIIAGCRIDRRMCPYAVSNRTRCIGESAVPVGAGDVDVVQGLVQVEAKVIAEQHTRLTL